MRSFRKSSILESALKTYLAALWCVCVYRAATQSITHDEAFTFELYLTRGTRWIFTYFDANNHLLATLLMKASVWLFGASEWSLRLPSLIGAGLYFAATYRISQAFRTALGALTATALLTLNPFIMDLMVAARGYGLALALWMLGFVWLLEFKNGEHPSRARLSGAGLVLALSVAANLTFLVPSAALVGTAAILSARRRAIGYHLIPPMACVLALLLLATPLDRTTRGKFYFGSSTIQESLRSMAEVAVAHGPPFRGTQGIDYWVDAVGFGLAPSVLLAALVIGIRSRNVLLILASAPALGSAAILVLAHLSTGLPYPYERTGFYFQALVPLALAGIADQCSVGSVRARTSAVFAFVAAFMLLAQFLLQFDTRMFLTWQYDADTRRIVQRIAQSAADKGPGTVRVGASWMLEPSLNFYRRTKRLVWMQEVKRAPVAPGADYYVLTGADRGVIGSLKLRPIYEGSVSGTILAIPAWR